VRITSTPPCWCQPAPSPVSTAIAVYATRVLVSARCKFVPSVLGAGVIIAAPTQRTGQMAPNRSAFMPVRGPSLAALGPEPKYTLGCLSGQAWLVFI
jgi:hypothetical protein